ncbi:MAG TPA: L,D-transpeptidase [Anaerolineales bacterium]|nr:L,D-transpeptidase [Anaerolineales bacterium]
MKTLSRRDFLKLSGLGLASFMVPPLNFDSDDPFDLQQGRVTVRTVWVYDKPTLEATKVKLLQRDAIFNITNTAVTEDIDSHNRIWYQVGTDGYVPSGNIQPVRTMLSQPYTANIPIEGLLAEVCVPYTDAFVEPSTESKVGYRIYYETTHWVKALVAGKTDGQPWYQIRDDKWDELYYVRADHIRIMTPEELAPITPEVPLKEKKIVVQLEQQLVTAYEMGVPVFSVPVSTGARLRSGTYTTPSGNFITYYKRPSRHMAAGDIAASGFDLPGVPWVQYLTKSGISFHGTFWHNDYGRPRSHGCINMSCSAAKWLFLWSSPSVPVNKEFTYGQVGTKVEIL